MLKRIYIDNFRSFLNFEYIPERTQLLLGSNGSGKTSLIDAIRYVKQFIEGDESPFTQSTRTRWQDKPLQVVEIEALLDGQKYEYRLEIRFDPKTKQPAVNAERLMVSGASVFELADGEIRFFSNDGKQAAALPHEATRSELRFSQHSNSHVGTFMEWLRTVHCFEIDAYPGEMGEESDSEEHWPDFELGNFSGWYRYLVGTYPEENLRFTESLREALDGFQNLRFSAQEDGVRKLRVDFTAPAMTKVVSYSLSELSDGQRHLLALYSILHFLIAKGHTVFIDEPDNFVSLREIQPWLLAAEAAVEDHGGQLILISHHPEILNQWAARCGLRFFREENGHVRTEKFKTDAKGELQPSELIARGWENE